jgi:hypothetical protein
MRLVQASPLPCFTWRRKTRRPYRGGPDDVVVRWAKLYPTQGNAPRCPGVHLAGRRQVNAHRTNGPAGPLLAYPPLPERPRRGSRSAVHETPPSYRTASRPSGRRAVRATVSGPSPRPAGSRVRLHLKPGQKGTKRLLEQYGDRLICVRYRYDPDRKSRFKTVELIVAERDWQPPRPRLAPDRIVGVQVAFAEHALRERVKRAGGVWNAKVRVWQLPHDRAVALGLAARIVGDPTSVDGCLLAAPQNTGTDARGTSR